MIADFRSLIPGRFIHFSAQGTGMVFYVSVQGLHYNPTNASRISQS